MHRNPKLLIAAVLVLLTATLSVSVLAVSDETDADSSTLVQYNLKQGESVTINFLSYLNQPTPYGPRFSIYPEAFSGSRNALLPPGITYDYSDYFVGFKGTPTTAGAYTFACTFVAIDPSSGTVTDERIYTVTLLVFEKVTYHNANGSTSVGWYSPYYPHHAPSGTATSGQFCGWNTASNGSGMTYLEGSVVPPGISDMYYQQSSSPATVNFVHSSTFTSNNSYVRYVIPNQPVMLPAYVGTLYSSVSDIRAEFEWNTVKAGTGTSYSNSQPVQIASSLTLYGQQAKTDPSRTVVVSGTVAYYVPRGETFDFTFAGVPYHNSSVNFTTYQGWTSAPGIYRSGTREMLTNNYTMTASSDAVFAEYGNLVMPLSVRYMSNGGTGTMMSDIAGVQTMYGYIFTMKAGISTFTPPAGKMFKQWHQGSATGPSISPGGVISTTGNTFLFAEWMDIPPDPVWVITYDANGGTGTITPSTVVQGQPYTVTSQSFTAPNQRSFVGWGILGTTTVYDPGDIFTPTSDITLVAIWKWDYFYVNLIPNEAPGDVVNLTSPGDQSYIMPPNPFTWQDHVFTGWRVNNSEPTLSVGYEFWPQANINLYAQWIDTSTPPVTLPEIPIEWIAIGVLAVMFLILFVVVIRDDD